MKILICSREYSPDITPVAFWAEALTQEFLRRGYQVDLFIPGNKVVTAQPGNLRMVAVGGYVWRKSVPETIFKGMVRNLLGVKNIRKLKKYLFYFGIGDNNIQLSRLIDLGNWKKEIFFFFLRIVIGLLERRADVY